MEGFYLLCAHLLGDYILQNDWMARWKTANRGETTDQEQAWILSLHGDVRLHAMMALDDWARKRPGMACLLHCVLYTLAVLAFSWWWMPMWGLLACLVVHFVIDRTRFARCWMLAVGQKAFATGPLSPWSIIVVDNTFHLLTLAAIAAACGR